MNDKAVVYLGKKFEAGATGPDSFDCWTLVLDWYRENCSINLPKSPADATSIREVQEASDDFNNADEWEEFLVPVEDCIVLMGRGRYYTHAGIYLGDDLVLHCSAQAKGCIVQKLRTLRAQWPKVKFYCPTDDLLRKYN